MNANREFANTGSILCLCEEDDQRKIIPGYAHAFRALGIRFVPVDWKPPFDIPLDRILARCPEKPSWIFHFESDFPLLPEGLVTSEIPTVSFQVDTYAFTERRMLWSSLFDHVAVFHPGYEKRFRDQGHPGAFLTPHAVCRDFYDHPELPRKFEIGWVGQAAGPTYRKREEWLAKLSSDFCMNDFRRSYSLREVADVYLRSRVAVNIGRDDFPEDANMRVFEVLAAGTLLITSLPNELTRLGFVDGVHFVGYRKDSEIIPLVRRFLQEEGLRRRIADAGRSKVLEEHTYDVRASEILNRLQRFGGKKLAPARNWEVAQVTLAYMDFFVSSGLNSLAEAQFRRVNRWNLRDSFKGAVLLGKARLKKSRRLLNSRLTSGRET